ncbi:hypothetical protein CHLNCDRAFT_142066 [Chlorella variabilis]|uniref:Uncharacterized protein n=1 Tax=Chlorella variabilis TaxID=554065 RepID=E1Z7P1_CHLVA|nr:hypothetical protein CHLNCDRAFT_142066 [Chlorella variabilis]EFN57952.1 hypothetical protein CHLNCDRAFT_142066 [Chlorella variabilis]|eukprot:XP_005850054.1 hypothetical protein CHLNCDRAFT_142066 [Chlorella variabilis]
MAAEGGGPPAGGSGAQDWLKLSSFDAASFFKGQQQEQEEQRTLQGQQLQAAADMLLPSSSEEESSSELSGEEEEGRGPAADRRRRSPSAGASGEEGRSKKRRREERRRREGKEEKRRRREKRGKEKRRHRESEREQQVRLERQTGAAQRASQVKAWAPAGASAKKEKAQYYFDTRGDAANLAFGGLYRMDVAQYRRFDPAHFAASLGAARRGTAYGIRYLATEADGHAQHDRASRYFGPASLRAERSARLKRWRRSLPQPAAQQAGTEGEPTPAALLGWRGPPPASGPEAQQPQRRRMDLPSLNFLPLRVEDAEQQRQQPPPGQGPAFQQQQQRVAPSAAEELAAEKEQRRRREGETNEELLLRRTREFNEATRQRSHDVQLWLEFAHFQDEAVRLGPPRRGGERGAAEKKIAILEKALSLHPGSDELLLALLKAAEAVCDDSELERRWRAVLARHSGSPRLWRAYLHHRRTRFSGFSAVEVAAAYDDAFAALHREHRRRAAQGAPPSALAPLEAEAAAVAVEGAQLRLAAGATERAVAALQVLLEFNFLAPEGWPEDALEAMFEEFWRSGAPMAGQPGAAGWASWIAGEPGGATTAAAAAEGSKRRRQRREEAAEEERRQQEQQQQQQGAAEQGTSWSGWEEMAPAIRARFGHSLRMEEGAGEEAEGAAAVAGEDGEEGLEDEEEAEEDQPPEEETDEQLLERLGMHLEAALEEASTTLTPPLLDTWLGMERQRQAAQWQPRRAEAPAAAGDGNGSGEEEEDDEEAAAHRTVAWRDVRRLLWRFESEPARQQLLAGCLRLLGAPLPGALPSNSPAASAAAGGADELWQAAAAAGCHPGRAASDGGSSTRSGGWVAEVLVQGDWGWLLGSTSSRSSGSGASPGEPPPPGLREHPWYQADGTRRELVTHLLAALVRGPGRQDAGVAEALLSAYAQLEVAAGSTKAARKVYQTCFATVGAPGSLAAASSAAALVLGAVQLELQESPAAASPTALPSPAAAAPSCIAGSLLRALLGATPDAAVTRAARQLAWLGSGGAVALPGPPSATAPPPLSQAEVVAAKRGFQDHLLALMQQQQLLQQQQAIGAPGGDSSLLTPGGCALVGAAAALEQLLGRLRGDVAGGAKAALTIYDQVLSALMPQLQNQQQVAAAGGAAQLPCDAQLELLSWQRCQLAADAARAALPCAPPRAVREALLRALSLYPSSSALLQLLVAHECAGHTLTQLRRELHAILERRPSPQLWLAMVAVEVTTHSPGAVVQATLERAVSSDSGRACPLLWRCYLRYEAYRGRRDAARRLFLRAIAACPWAKAVWCDGLALLNGHAPPKELSEYVEVMKDKELTLRTDVFEVVLAQLEGSPKVAAAPDSAP